MKQLACCAEFHDIGKLIDWKAIGLQATDKDGDPTETEPHDFEKCTDPKWDIRFSEPIWESIFRKDPQVRGIHYPNSLDWIFVSLADELAASIGRIREESVTGPAQYGYHCLWTGKTKGDPRLKDLQDVQELIRYLNENPPWAEAAHRYSHMFHSRAETARPGLNVTTLYSHAIVAGKLFRVLRRLGSASDQTLSSYNDALKAFESKKLTVIFIEVLFPQRPFRTRDLSIFRQRVEDINEITSRHQDSVLVGFAEKMLGVFLSGEEADCFIDEILGKGYLGLVRRGEKDLLELRSIGIEKALGSEKLLSRSVPDRISPPLCEGCQIDHGGHRWPAEMLAERNDLSLQTRQSLLNTPWHSFRTKLLPDNERAKLAEWLEEWGEENLCSRCYGLRTRAETLTKLSTWRTVNVAWARVAINFDDVIALLRQLQISYIEASATRIQTNVLKELTVRLPLLADFVEEYRLFLNRWRAYVEKAFGQERVEQVNEDLLCVKLTQRRESFHLLSTYHKVMTEHFPKMLKLDNAPVRFGLCISLATYPFFVHWRYLENPQTDICIQVIGGGAAVIPLKRLQDILQFIRTGDRRAIHRLRQIARTSEKLAEIVLKDRQDRDSKAFSWLRQAIPFGMSFESLVTLANLAES